MTLRLSSRCLDILNLLVFSRKPLSALDIGKQLNISARMVRSSLIPAEEWLIDKDITLRKIPGEGISLVGSEEARKKLSCLIRSYDHSLPWFNPVERLHISLLTIFFSDNPLQIKQLQKVLHVSRSTTICVLDQAEKWINTYHLKLIRKQNVGCRIDGEENNWREAVVDLIQETAGIAQLLALFQGIKTVVDIPYRNDRDLDKKLQNVWERLDISLIKKTISPIENEIKGLLSDQAYIVLCISISISIYRYRMGHGLGTNPEISKHPIFNQQHTEIIKITDRFNKLFGIKLPENELNWIALRLPSRIPSQLARKENAFKIHTDDETSIQNIVDQILSKVSLSLHPSLRADENLNRNLVLLIETIFYNNQWKFTSKNPLLQEVKSQYPSIYSVAKQCSSDVATHINRDLNETEIGNLAICLIAAVERMSLMEGYARKVMVVSSAGMATTWLLVSRLQVEFPQLEVVEVVSAFDLEKRKHIEGVDFIIGTIPLKSLNLPSLRVDPLLGVEDCKNLERFLKQKRSVRTLNNRNTSTAIHLSDLITSDMIELGLNANTWIEVVEKAGSRLMSMGVIENTFIQAMKQMILEYGPYMVIWPGVVLLHAPPQGVRRLCMGLINLREPVSFGHSDNDPVRTAIVLGAIDGQSHIVALQELNEMMQDENARSAIQNTFHKSVVLKWISKYSHKYENVI